MPNAWQIGNLTVAGVIMGIGELVFATSVLTFGAYQARLDIETLRTLAFVIIVFGNQATTYANRERRHLWSSRPSTAAAVRVINPSAAIACAPKRHVTMVDAMSQRGRSRFAHLHLDRLAKLRSRSWDNDQIAA